MIGIDTSAEHVLEDDAVLLRPLGPDDHEHLLPFSLNEPEIWTYSLQRAIGPQGLATYLRTALAARAKGTEYPFIVFDKRTGSYAGSTRFYDINTVFGTAQLGYTWYGKAFQGTGLNKHCKFLLLCFAFETCGLERVEFRADANNERSIAAMKRIGCTVEGILRSHMPDADGGRRSSIVLSILRDEWYDGVKAALSSQLS
ncbi:MAG: GNAT family N-acetyltransferase [Flavobacteriales bacterium]|nr:GNAT family N-acetyltransferase [Flavobacteriales bacterium]